METIGRYEIIRELGRGAMGVVYRARDPKIDREVAIKTIKLSDKADSSEIEGLRARLVREAQSAGKLSHPNIVTVYDVDEVDDVAFIAMELVEGQTLEDLLKRGRITDCARIAQILEQAAAALDYAHSKGIVHRDVKPGNLMLAADGVVKIMDFGIARIGSSNLTQTGSVLGTPSYMSPEQVKGDELDGRSDQFSLGVIAYEMLTGQKPFPGENLTAVIFKIVSKEPKPINELTPDVPADVVSVVMQALSKEPTDRFDDCRSFADAFAEAAGAPAQATETVDETREISQVAPVAAAPEPTGAFGTEETQVYLGVDASPNDSARLPPLRRDAAPAPAEEPKKNWVARIALGVVAALLLAVVGFAAFNPAALEDLKVALGLAEPAPQPESPYEERLQSTIEAPPPVDEPESEVVAAPEPRNEEAPSDAPAQAERAPAPEPPAEKPAETKVAEKAPEPEPEPEPPPAPTPKPPPAKRKVAIKSSAPKAEKVSVYFRTNQRGARIAVDDRPDWTCETPCRIEELPAGSHTVTAKLEGFHTARRMIELGANAQEVVDIRLEDARITALISSEPTGGDIYIDGRKIPQKTNAKVPLARGTYRIKVSKEGYGEAEQVLVVDKDQIPYAKFLLGQAQ